MSMLTDSLEGAVIPAASPPRTHRSWAIHDPVGLTTTRLADLGVHPRPLDGARPASSDDVIVVGARCLTETTPLPVTASEIAAGRRLVVFEQSPAALHAMGFRTEDVVPRFVFPRVSDHPVLAGIPAERLRNWRGAGTLIPATKDNAFPYPDLRMHWGNQGSVASVVIETPHSGAFTPVLESGFDLAYTPLLEWRHGKGAVLFCQLDVTGRTEADPVADLVVANIVRYLDGGSLDGPDADRPIAFVGDDEDDLALLEGLGLAHHRIPPERITPRHGEIIMIGRGASDLPRASANKLRAHVRGGGTVVFLPRTAAELSASAWPWPVTTAPGQPARLLAEEAPPELLRGIGPQLTHWRTHLSLDLIRPDGLPPHGERLLGGLVGEVPDGRGRWVILQLDWRGLAAQGNNLRRPRWNTRKLYRQVLTNLGARSNEMVGAGVAPAASRSPFVTIDAWRAVAGAALPWQVGYASGGYRHYTLPGLDELFAAEAWPTATGSSWGTVIDSDDDGYVDLASVVPDVPPEGPTPGQTAYACTYLYSAQERPATFRAAAARWMVFKINGEAVWDDGYDGTDIIPDTVPPATSYGATLRQGWNKVEVGVAASYKVPFYGVPTPPNLLGFTFHTEDPGDLAVDASVDAPTEAPGTGPATRVTAPISLYTEQIPAGEHVYRHTIY